MFFSLLQSAVEEGYLGRVSSVASSVSSATLPVGSLFGGFLAEFVGVEAVFTGFGATFFLLGAYFLVVSDLRTLPAIADSDEETLGLPANA